MQKLEGKWVVTKSLPVDGWFTCPHVVFVHKETTKQIVAGSYKEEDNRWCQTIRKSYVEAVVPEEEVETLRAAIKGAINKFGQEQEDLRASHIERLNNICQAYKGEKYEIDGE